MAGGLRGRHPGSSAVIGGASCVYVCGLGCICGPAAPSAELLSLFGSDPEHRVGLHRRVPFQLCLGVGRGLGAQLLKTEQSSADASVSCDPAAKAREVDFDFDIRCCSCARGQSLSMSIWTRCFSKPHAGSQSPRAQCKRSIGFLDLAASSTDIATMETAAETAMAEVEEVESQKRPTQKTIDRW